MASDGTNTDVSDRTSGLPESVARIQAKFEDFKGLLDRLRPRVARTIELVLAVTLFGALAYWFYTFLPAL